jgi:hypothetical protein
MIAGCKKKAVAGKAHIAYKIRNASPLFHAANALSSFVSAG